MADVTSLYLQAPALREAGERVVSTDEMTGIQALERKHPTIPMGPGRRPISRANTDRRRLRGPHRAHGRLRS